MKMIMLKMSHYKLKSPNSVQDLHESLTGNRACDNGLSQWCDNISTDSMDLLSGWIILVLRQWIVSVV